MTMPPGFQPFTLRHATDDIENTHSHADPELSRAPAVPGRMWWPSISLDFGDVMVWQRGPFGKGVGQK